MATAPDPNDELKWPTPGERLRAFRKNRKLTIKQLADLVGEGAHFTTVSKIERGAMTMSIAWAERFSRALNIDPAELVISTNSKLNAQMIPCYSGPDWLSYGDLKNHEPMYWVAVTRSSASAYCLSWADDTAPGSNIPVKFDEGWFLESQYVIEPDRRELIAGVLYAILLVEEGVVIIAIYRSIEREFADYRAKGVAYKVGDHPFKLLGTVTRHTQLYPWSIDYQACIISRFG